MISKSNRPQILLAYGVLVCLVSVVLADTSEVTIRWNPSVQYQKYLGWGAFLARWDSPHMYFGSQQGAPIDAVPQGKKQEILRLLFTDLGLNSITLSLRGGAMDPSYVKASAEYRSHEPDNDNSNHQMINWKQLNFSYWPPLLRTVRLAMSQIQNRGEEPLLFLRVSGTEAWMDRDDPAFAREYAEWVVSLLLYLRDQQRIEIGYVSLINEPDGIGQTSPGLLLSVVKEARLLLLRYRLSTAIIIPETVTPRSAVRYLNYFQNAGALDMADAISYHIYDHDASRNQAAPLIYRNQLRAIARRLNLPVFMTEQSSDVKANQRTFWFDTQKQALALANDFVTEVTQSSASGMTCCMWTFWSDLDSHFGSDAFIILRFDPQDHYRFLGYKRTKMFFTVGRIIRTLPPGYRRFQVDSSERLVRVVGFRDPSFQKAVIVIINNSSGPRTILFPNKERLGIKAGEVSAVSVNL